MINKEIITFEELKQITGIDWSQEGYNIKHESADKGTYIILSTNKEWVYLSFNQKATCLKKAPFQSYINQLQSMCNKLQESPSASET